MEAGGIEEDAVGAGVLRAMREKGGTYEVPAALLQHQVHITATMRAILLDWLMEVSQEYRLKRETLHYAVNYVDRFLAKTYGVLKAKLQLVGVTALYVAAKVEEVYPLPVSDFALTTAGASTSDEIREMETFMLLVLNCELVPPTTFTWVSAIVHAVGQLSSQLHDDSFKVLRPGIPRLGSGTPGSAALHRPSPLASPELCCKSAVPPKAAMPPSARPLDLDTRPSFAVSLKPTSVATLAATSGHLVPSDASAAGAPPPGPTPLAVDTPLLGCRHCRGQLSARVLGSSPALGSSRSSPSASSPTTTSPGCNGEGCSAEAPATPAPPTRTTVVFSHEKPTALFPNPRSPVDLVLRGLALGDACLLLTDSLQFRRSILAGAILLVVGGEAYADILGQLLPRIVLEPFGQLEELALELASAYEFVQRVHRDAPAYRQHAALHLLSQETVADDLFTAQPHTPALLDFAKARLAEETPTPYKPPEAVVMPGLGSVKDILATQLNTPMLSTARRAGDTGRARLARAPGKKRKAL